jgi:hypothetical protein
MGSDIQGFACSLVVFFFIVLQMAVRPVSCWVVGRKIRFYLLSTWMLKILFKVLRSNSYIGPGDPRLKHSFVSRIFAVFWPIYESSRLF